MPSRSYEWNDVDINQDFLSRMSGLEYCRAILSGDYPVSPIFQTLDIRFDAVEPGFASLSMEPHPFLVHGRGILNGGAISTLLDTAMAWAALSTLEKGSGFTTAHLGIDFLRPTPAGSGAVRAEGRVINRGRRLILLEAKAINAQGKLVATGGSTCMVYDIAVAGN